MGMTAEGGPQGEASMVQGRSKSDATIQEDVLRELTWDTRVEETAAGVDVDEGPVTLTGTGSGTIEPPGHARPYRPVGYGERAVRRACPQCHDRHAVLVNWRLWVLQCRACGHVFERPCLFGSRERRPGPRPEPGPGGYMRCESAGIIDRRQRGDAP